MKNRGQIAVASLLSISALVGSVAAPILWLSQLKEVNAVQDVKIANIQAEQTRIEDEYTQLNNKIDALLIRNGIDPERISITKP